MSIVNEINRLQQAKSDLAVSIENKGVTVPAATTIDGYAALVDQIQQGGSGVPYDAEIEYLQSTGKQYINTGITPDSLTGFKCDIQITDTSNSRDAYVIGLRNDSGNTRWGVGENLSGYYYMRGTHQDASDRLLSTSFTNISYNWKGDYIFTAADGSSSNTKSLSQSLPFTPAYPIWIFGASGYAASQSYGKGKARITSFQISQGSNMIMDLIPVRIGQVGFMYDKITNKFFGNSGTGSFTLGPDVT